MAMVLSILSAYACVGALFAAGFVARGAATIDPVARGAPLRVRLLFAPAALALWPMLLRKWLRTGRTQAGSPAGNAH